MQVNRQKDRRWDTNPSTVPPSAITSTDAAIAGLSSPNGITRIHADSRDYPDACALNVPSAAAERQCAEVAQDSIFDWLNDEQAAGEACVVCPVNYLDTPRDRVEVGNGTGIYVCADRCAPLLGFDPADGWQGGAR